MIKLLSRRKWTNRKIAFVGILIATSVSFVLIFSTIAPIVAMPTFKVATGGLPIKITGYIFGPVIGGITGVISDLLSFTLRPFNIHYFYTLAFACAGIIPGAVSYLMNRRWKYQHVSQPPIDEKKYNKTNFLVTIFIILLLMSAVVGIVFSQPASVFENGKFIKNRYIFTGIVLGGSGSLLLMLIIFRFIFKPKTFNSLLPLVVFSALLELVNTPLVSLGDYSTLTSTNQKDSFLFFLTSHFLFSPLKAWVNLVVIYVSYKIIAPLIFNKTSNGWESNLKDNPTVDVKINKDHIQLSEKIEKGRKK